MRFKRTFRRRPMARARRAIPDVVPVNICHTATPLSVGDAKTLDQACTNLQDMTLVVRSGVVLVDGGAFTTLGNQIQGMTRGLKFRSFKGQYDFHCYNPNTTKRYAYIWHGLFKVNLINGVAGRAPAWIPNPASDNDQDIGDCLWRHWDKLVVPEGVAGGLRGQASLAAGVAGNTVITAIQHGPNAMSAVSRRNLREDEGIVWVVCGFVMNVTTELTVVDLEVQASLSGRMTLNNWQS